MLAQGRALRNGNPLANDYAAVFQAAGLYGTEYADLVVRWFGAGLNPACVSYLEGATSLSPAAQSSLRLSLQDPVASSRFGKALAHLLGPDK